MPLILAHVPDAHLVLIGQGPYLKHLQTMVTKFKLQENVSFIGRIQYQDLPQYISIGEIFAMPSRSRFAGLEVEGLGIVYLEASACGLPVVAGDSGGAPDAVIEGRTGYVVKGTSPQEISARIVELLVDEDLRKNMGEAGRQWIVKEWRWEIWADKFTKVLAG
jgi:phosphatidylinositol alpha-1,6-mannosyltransferase